MPNTTVITSKIQAKSPKKQSPTVVHNKKNNSGYLLGIQHRIAVNTNHPGMAMCARYAIRTPWNEASIKGVNGKVSVQGAVMCRSRLCPICAVQRACKEEAQLEQVLTYHAECGGTAHFCTYTKRTILDIEKSYKANREGIKAQNQYLRNQKKSAGIEVARYTIFEDTYSEEPVFVGSGENVNEITTAHNHSHGCYLFGAEVSKVDREKILKGLVKVWIETMKSHGTYTSQRGIDVKLIDNSLFTHTKIAKYLSGIITPKTKIFKELSSSHTKLGTGRSLSELMIDIDQKNRECDLKAYRDTVNTYKGKQRTFRCKNWIKLHKQAVEYHESKLKDLAQKYIDNLGLCNLLVEKCIKRSPTIYSFMDNLKHCQNQDKNKIEYEIAFSHDLYDYLSKSRMITKIMRGVSVASSGDPIPVSIQVLKDFAMRRSNYNNPLMKNDKEINDIIQLLNKEVALGRF